MVTSSARDTFPGMALCCDDACLRLCTVYSNADAPPTITWNAINHFCVVNVSLHEGNTFVTFTAVHTAHSGIRIWNSEYANGPRLFVSVWFWHNNYFFVHLFFFVGFGASGELDSLVKKQTTNERATTIGNVTGIVYWNESGKFETTFDANSFEALVEPCKSCEMHYSSSNNIYDLIQSNTSVHKFHCMCISMHKTWINWWEWVRAFAAATVTITTVDALAM